MDEYFDWEKIARYLSNESSAEERREIEAWMDGDPLRKEYVDSLRLLWTTAGPRPSEWDTDSAWTSISARAGIPRFPHSSLPHVLGQHGIGDMHHRSLSEFTRVVIATIALVGIPYVLFQILGENRSSSPSPAMREVVTGRGERARIRLTDGTSVLLNSESTIRFPESFAEGSRELILQGEAYFDVTRMDHMPFLVHVQNASVEVLGTEFNVRAWPDEECVRVVVAHGSVAFHSPGKESPQHVVLKSGEMSDLIEGGSFSLPQTVDLHKQLDWIGGRLIFENTLFREVIRRLQRTYGVECLVRDSSALHRRLTASFSNETVDDVGRIIALTLDLQYKKSGNTIVFNPPPSVRRRKPQ